MADITHEAIAARVAEIRELRWDAARAAEAPFDKEAASLQELCGGLGHRFEGATTFHLGDGWLPWPCCTVCGGSEIKGRPTGFMFNCGDTSGI